MCIGAVVVWPGGGGGIDAGFVFGARSEGGGAERAGTPFASKAPKAAESVAPFVAAPLDAGSDELRGGPLKMSSRLAWTAGFADGASSSSLLLSGSSLSNTCVASSSSSQSIWTFAAPRFAFFAWSRSAFAFGIVVDDGPSLICGAVSALEAALLRGGGPLTLRGGFEGATADGGPPSGGRELRAGGGSGGRDAVPVARSVPEGGTGGPDRRTLGIDDCEGRCDGAGAGLEPVAGVVEGGADRLCTTGAPTAGVNASEGGAAGATGVFATDGGGGTVDVRTELFLPRPSKISRSELPLFSFDIRVS